MRLLEQILPAAGAMVLFLVVACSSVEPSATPAIGATAEAQVRQILETLTPRPTLQDDETARLTLPPQTATLRPSPMPTLTIATPAQSPAITSVPTRTPESRGGAQWIIQLEAEVHELVNRERLKASLGSLAVDSALADVARRHSQDMATNTFFAHENLIGQDSTDRADAAGYSCVNQGYVGVGENIFQGWLFSAIMTSGSLSIKAYLDLDELAGVVVDGWMDSLSHRLNMLTARYNKEGIGIAINPDTERVLVTQNLC